jgi:hypothetical protein
MVHASMEKLVKIKDKNGVTGDIKRETQHFPHAQVIACPHAKFSKLDLHNLKTETIFYHD